MTKLTFNPNEKRVETYRKMVTFNGGRNRARRLLEGRGCKDRFQLLFSGGERSGLLGWDAAMARDGGCDA